MTIIGWAQIALVLALVFLWGRGHREDMQYLRVYIGHLRQKLGPGAAGLIRTDAGVGYRMADPEPQHG